MTEQESMPPITIEEANEEIAASNSEAAARKEQEDS